ncbi:MAG: inositol monophosphatase [Candidatus Omnitrophica bacterium]|nr:inositol monophosphatase [Candidatus Omnitrophota bacterium]
MRKNTLSQPEIDRYLSVAAQAARQAGKYLFLKSSAVQVVAADLPHDLKLQADKESEKILVRYLQRHSTFPILSEECGLIGSDTAPVRWIVDPLDGTINYSRRIPLACVSVGLWQEGVPLLGVVYDFFRKEIFSGIVGKGAWLNGRAIMASSVRRKRDAVLATGFPGKMDLSGESLENFAHNVRAYKKPRLIGSAALSLAYVAAGRFDAYAERDIMLWDIAAGVALVQAAGGRVGMKKSTFEHGVHVQACNGRFRT